MPQVVNKLQRHDFQTDFFATDTSEVEDLVDNIEVVGIPNDTASSFVGSEAQPTYDEDESTIPRFPDRPETSTPILAQKSQNSSQLMAELFYASSSPGQAPSSFLWDIPLLPSLNRRSMPFYRQFPQKLYSHPYT